MTRTIRPSPHADLAQRHAGDPSRSVWVSANAGSGKTHVLTRRVVRLLLAGVAPEAILCLTYTKAAAAEMRARVAKLLAGWALMDEARLAAALSELSGRPPDPAELDRARTLFARALETPGGLRILTIHAFCESVLHRFPVEAGVPFDFKVIEDHDRARMILSAREAVLAGGLAGSAEERAVLALFARLSDSQIGSAIDTALSENRRLRPILAARGAARTNLRRLVGDPGTVEAIEAEMLDRRLVGPGEIAAIVAASRPLKGREAKLAALDPETPDCAAWLSTFLTTDFAVPRSAALGKGLAKTDPGLAELAMAEAERLAGLCARRKRALLLARSEALLDVLGAIVDHYEAAKRARSLVDFDDLVERLGALLADPAQGDWIRYKLDAAITHILVDESQDTNAEQWKVVRQIADEFFAGDGAVERPRTLFAVGDEKQSIYSFQGADPRLFGEAGRHYAGRAREGSFARITLRTSFRTLQGILDAVDRVFAEGPPRAGVLALEEPVIHESARLDVGGRVVLWPPIAPDTDAEPADGWPVDLRPGSESPQRQLARRIAQSIGDWIASGRLLGPRKRPVAADDVMVLVQSRGPLFSEIIRALIAAGLPTPGADRLQVTAHIAVKDLLALGDVLLNPGDDLQLAALLRSPLFDVSDDDLIAILAERTRGESAWEALAAAPLPQAADAHARLSAWRGRLDFDRPYTFFAEILYAEGGLRRFRQRLGGEIDDVVAQFLELALDHEQSPQPSLQGFLAALRARDVTIRRELNETGGGVRVMTVHGAKGLESPIVILADATARPQGKALSRPVILRADGEGPLLVHASSEGDHVPETLGLRDADREAQTAEYWRKLYVGMTRAEDELYVTGVLGGRSEPAKQLEDTWYAAVEQALGPHSRPDDAEGVPGAQVYPAAEALAKRGTPVPRTEQAAPPVPDLPGPPRLFARPELHPPSRLGKDAPVMTTAAERAADPVDRDLARLSGVALHALLQHLGDRPATDRPALAAKALPILLPDHPDRHEDLARRAISILSRPELGWIFGPGSRAEVPFLMPMRRSGEAVQLAGRIDRLVIDEAGVTVIDYKSDASAPAGPSGVSGAYLTQLGLYALVAGQLFPGYRVRAGILWTALESLMILPPPLLATATERFTVG